MSSRMKNSSGGFGQLIYKFAALQNGSKQEWKRNKQTLHNPVTATVGVVYAGQLPQFLR